MAETVRHASRRRRRSRRGRLVWILGGVLATVFVIAFLAFGGVHAPTRAVLHAGLTVALLCAAAIDDRLLQRAGAVGPFVRASGVLLAVAAIGLLPVPTSLLWVLSPGAEHAAGAMTTVTASVPSTLTALTHGVLLLGAGVAVGVLAVMVVRRTWVERSLVGLAACLTLLAASHAAFHVESLLGVVPTWIQAPYRYFAPFLNPNHLASALLLPLPVLVGLAGGHLHWPRSARGGVGILALASFCLILGTGSVGAAAAAALQVLAVLVMVGRLPMWTLPAAFGTAVSSFVVLDRLADPGRLEMWAVAMRAWLRHWAMGSGVGTFDLAVSPLRTDHHFLQWVHAHNDLLEWVTETGLVGVVGLCIAVVGLWPHLRHAPLRARWLLLGVGGVACHALVEFPLQIPAIAMTCAAGLALATSAYREPTPMPVVPIRAGLVGLALLQGIAGAWQIQQTFESRALARADRASLAWWAPWHAQRHLGDAKAHAAAGRTGPAAATARAVAERAPGDPAAQRGAAWFLVTLGDLSGAAAAAERALHLAPHDWRSHATWAIVTESLRPEEAAEVWLDVVRHGGSAKMIRRGWRTLPVGLPWIEASAEHPAWYQRQVARTVLSLGDEDAALIGFEQAALTGGMAPDLGHVRLLARAGRAAEGLLLLDDLLAANPRNRHALRVRGEMLEARGRSDEAVAVWVRLSEVEPGAQARAVRAAAQTQGPDAALKLVEMLEGARGPHGVHAGARIEQARVYLDTGRAGRCAQVLEGSRALAHDRLGTRARELLQLCRSRR